MENYIVSARKYRPLSFSSVVGQRALTATLSNAVRTGKLAHAYLFCGPRGVGKTTCARIFAKAINCLSPTDDGEACNECESCRAFNEQRSYNIFELDAASNNSVENIKTLMDQTRIPPQVGRYKVFIIDEVHMLSTAAFNAFLKTLEEPPSYVVFILATTEKRKLLPTIISRCQIYDFERMSVQNTINHLKMVAEKEGISYEEEALALIAEKADGGMRDALSIFDQAASFCQGKLTYEKVMDDLNAPDADNFFLMVDMAYNNKVSDSMLLLNALIGKGFDGGMLINQLAAHCRNVLMAKDEATLPLLEVSERQRERFKEQAAKVSTKFLYRALQIANECDIHYRQSSNKRLLVEISLIEMAQITQEDEGTSAGRSPKRLKSLFRLLMQQSRQIETAKQVAVAATNAAITPSLSSLSNPQELAKKGEEGTPVATTTVTEQISAPATVAPKVRLKSLGGLTFKNLNITTTESVEEESTVKKETEIGTEQSEKPFDDDMLCAAWLDMCERIMKIESMRAQAIRMKSMRPYITTYPTIEVKVDNPILLSQLQDIGNRIRATLIRDLHNDNITLNFVQAEIKPEGPKLSRGELFKRLCEINPAIAKLAQELQLEMA